jgi:hypothetical protein
MSDSPCALKFAARHREDVANAVLGAILKRSRVNRGMNVKKIQTDILIFGR